jgi:hypothetical protein
MKMRMQMIEGVWFVSEGVGVVERMVVMAMMWVEKATREGIAC